jgi:uncharacterized protein (DUF305 family)
MKYIILIMIIIYIIYNIKLFKTYTIKRTNKSKSKSKSKKSPCSDDITDDEYLKHMIPHHQVAVDISYMLQKTTHNPKMQEILRNIIWAQEYEIAMMKDIIKTMPNDMSDNIMKMDTTYKPTVSSTIKPNKLAISGAVCDPDFFDPKAHMKKMNNMKMKLDDRMYINHMIPHHQIAVDMSKKLLNNTNNDFMIYLCYRIIRSQEGEIILLNDLIKSTYKMQSKLILF